MRRKIVVGSLSECKIWAEIKEKDCCWGFLEIWAEIEGRREPRGETCCWGFEQSKGKIGAREQSAAKTRKKEDRLLVGFISGSGKFGHKTTSANKRQDDGRLLLGILRKWKYGQKLRAERTSQEDRRLLEF